ncbi:uncharacterized protein KY384_007602 [Bacidia gigantensis]|uniref:uncharacterized protein n=1 Tax=Bacidia gigantensis TaxID=2732470 RepID=UPI001D05BCC7|nr:uncharacterized protein KY384_007602 [Bacidia gigantensis]KAG8527450.1 hypothetical protein KY384_007602 [Bacidia gigantensis]
MAPFAPDDHFKFLYVCFQNKHNESVDFKGVAKVYEGIKENTLRMRLQRIHEAMRGKGRSSTIKALTGAATAPINGTNGKVGANGKGAVSGKDGADAKGGAKGKGKEGTKRKFESDEDEDDDDRMSGPLIKKEKLEDEDEEAA